MPYSCPSMLSLSIAHRARRTTNERFICGSRWHRVYRRATDECELPPLDIRIRAMQLSPYRAGVAGPCPTRLLTSPAFPSCCCSLAFRHQVRWVASKSSALNFSLLWKQFSPCVPWRTLSAHPALTVQPSPDGAVASAQTTRGSGGPSAVSSVLSADDAVSSVCTLT